MSVFKSPYQTAAGSGYKVDSIIEALQEAYLHGWLHDGQKEYGAHIQIVGGGPSVDEKISTFFHPINFEADGKQMVAVDVRATGKFEMAADRFVPRLNARSDYDSIIMRGLLQDLWVNQGPETLRNFSTLPMGLFANWIAEICAKRLGLDTREQYTIMILAAIYYQNLFWDKDKADSSDKQFLVSTITRGLSLKAADVHDMVEMFPIIKDLGDFCETCQKANESPRLKQLNKGIISQIAGGYWYGNNAREIVAVALEHPPTWLTLIYQAITDKGMQKSGLSDILKRPSWKRQHDQYVRQVTSLVSVDF